MGNGTLKDLSKLDEVFKADQGDRKQFNALSSFVRDECKRRLQAYDAQPRDATEHFEIENDILSGGYAYRQLFELVQNAADAILESGEGRGRIYVRLSPDRLVAANTGASLDQDGVVALLNARSSSKRGNQIGRFGIGFKSLLNLGGSVDLVSRSIGLRFDPAKCRSIIRNHLGLPEDAAAPGMRLADVLEPDLTESPLSANAEYAWATTVVTAEIASASVFDRLAEEMAGFPAEFLLFLPANIELVLVTQGGVTRSLSKRVDGVEAVVTEGDAESRWQLFEAKVHVGDAEALSDATHIQARDEIPLSWAVPLTGRDAAGRFWAFFPTETHTLTSGILNAPWKLNSDRTNLIRGPWNNAIMQEAARLIAASLPSLATGSDCGAPLGAFPRQPDRQDEIAAPLAKAIWDHIVAAEILPNANGVLCRPCDLTSHCVEDEDLCLEWTILANPSVRDRFLHPDCYKYKVRISRIRTLKLEAVRRDIDVLGSSTAEKWLECLASSSIDQAKNVIMLAGKLLQGRPEYIILGMPAPRIIVAQDGSLLTPPEAVIPDKRGAPAGFVPVADELIADSHCRVILVELLKVKDLTGCSWADMLKSSLQKASQGDSHDVWERFWDNISVAPKDEAHRFMAKTCKVNVRYKTLSDAWREHGLVAIPAERDPVPDKYALDLEFFRKISDLLPEGLWDEFPLGVEKYPSKGDLLNRYCGWVCSSFDRICKERVGSIPRSNPRIQGANCVFPKGWRILSVIPPEPAARLTLHLLRLIMAGQPDVKPVMLEHPTRPNAYPKVTAPHPIWLWLTVHGYIQIGNRAVPLSSVDCQRARALAQTGMPGFEELRFMFNVRDEGCELVGLFARRSAATDAAGFWLQVFSALSDQNDEFRNLTGIWELAYLDGYIPEHLPTAEGPMPLNRIHVTSAPPADTDPDDGHVIILPENIAQAWVEAGAQALSVGPAYGYESICAPPARLLDVFPEMTVEPELVQAFDQMDAIWVEELRAQHGPRTFAIEVAMESEKAVLLDAGFFKENGRAAGISVLLRLLARNQLIPAGERLDQILENIIERRVEQARLLVRSQSTPARRLLQAVGGTAEPLLDILTPSISRALSEDVTGEAVADLVLAVYGPSTLSKLKSIFKAQGLMPPERWGGEQAIEFVADIGFPVEFASSVSRRRDAELYVSGPMPLPPLHDYQENILDDIQSLIEAGNARRRAVVSLPTGGGKTRVVAEAIVRLVLRGDGRRSALWIAQTDELCEQAVQCFRQLWVNLGDEGEDLRIIRMWGGQRNPIPPENEDTVVIIASIQTLCSRLDHNEIAWITRSGVIVIDECHHAITSSYTNLMRWLDLQVGSEKARTEEPPMLGLSATPWRGFNEDESRRLANRFDNRWFPADQASLHHKLSSMGVLSQRHYRALPYNRPIRLSSSERAHMDQFGELPDSVLERISDDDRRNEIIVNAVLKSNAKSILLFANSVAHAQYLAARLHLQGCSAAAVSGETDRLARQHFTKRFRDNDLRVICNCRVLTTGFDAPKADMILIAQPVFSPVLYMQMVGRGLRGEANGGTSHCEITTVEDNIVSYSDRLAYHFCRRYFDE